MQGKRHLSGGGAALFRLLQIFVTLAHTAARVIEERLRGCTIGQDGFSFAGKFRAILTHFTGSRCPLTTPASGGALTAFLRGFAGRDC
jgi:hypothetical protein